MHMVRSHHSPQSPSSNRKSARISPVRVRRQHLLALRGQGPFGILLRDETQYDEFVADGIGRQLGAAVGQPFEGRARGLAKEIGRAHVRTPVTNAPLVSRLLLEKK